MDQKINLNDLSDEQKVWLSQLSYLDINEEGRLKIEQGTMTINDLPNYLDDPDKSYFGTFLVKNDELFIKGSDTFMGGKTPLSMTNKELAQTICEKGLGGLKITAVNEEQGKKDSGLQVIAFRDDYGNVGISYRGSDADIAHGMKQDWIEANMLEFFKNDSRQIQEAKEFFEQNKIDNGQNFLYGHSLGGNLVQHIYCDQHHQIAEAFTINGNPINEKLINTQEKIDAFNDPNKFNCYIINGDVIGHLKTHQLYKNNVRFVENGGELTGLKAHFAQSGKYDKEGNFVRTTERQVEMDMPEWQKKMFQKMHEWRDKLNEREDRKEERESIGRDDKESVDLDSQYDEEIDLDDLETTFGETVERSGQEDSIDLDAMCHEVESEFICGNSNNNQVFDGINEIDETVMER